MKSGRQLGVRYLLQGSVRKQGNRARITVELDDEEAGLEKWGDHFDVEGEDVLGRQRIGSAEDCSKHSTCSHFPRSRKRTDVYI